VRISLFVPQRDERKDRVDEFLFLGRGGAAFVSNAAAPPTLSFNSTTRDVRRFSCRSAQGRERLVSPARNRAAQRRDRRAAQDVDGQLGPMPLMLMSSRNISRSCGVTSRKAGALRPGIRRDDRSTVSPRHRAAEACRNSKAEHEHGVADAMAVHDDMGRRGFCELAMEVCDHRHELSRIRHE